ncbi:MAG TPA: methyl-accepting chemotaxis protein [Myxococcaceae bacterium]
MSLPPYAALAEALSGGGTMAPGTSAALAVGALLLGGVVLAQLWAGPLVAGALATYGDDTPAARLLRALELPGRVEVAVLACHAFAAAATFGGLLALGELGPTSALFGAVCAILLSSVALFPPRQGLDARVGAALVEESLKSPGARPQAAGPYLPRLSWYLGYRAATASLAAAACGSVPLWSAYHPVGSKIAAAVALAAVLGSAVMGFQRLGARQAQAARKIRSAVDSLVSGPPRPPAWLSADELGDLAAGTAVALQRTAELSWAVQHARDLVKDTQSLRASAEALEGAARQLGASSLQQTEVLSAQAAALQETQITAQEIRQTSQLAAQKAESVLKQAELADQVSRAGETVTEQSLSGLTDIRDQVKDMSSKIRELDDRARQIANITVTVKDIADQSNMLALNAAIEAVRSGEHGKGFGVVAREIRTLADQSIKATNHVRDILQTIGEAIRSAVSMSDRGVEKVDRSLEQVRASGDTIRQLSAIVRDSAASVRQIAAAVNQQNAGIGQIFTAVGDLTKMMDRSMDQLRATETATDSLRSESSRVGDFVKTLRDRTGGGAAAAGRVEGNGSTSALQAPAPAAVPAPAPAPEKPPEPNGASGLS